jgi:hypothetical protein
VPAPVSVPPRSCGRQGVLTSHPQGIVRLGSGSGCPDLPFRNRRCPAGRCSWGSLEGHQHNGHQPRRQAVKISYLVQGIAVSDQHSPYHHRGVVQLSPRHIALILRHLVRPPQTPEGSDDAEVLPGRQDSASRTRTIVRAGSMRPALSNCVADARPEHDASLLRAGRSNRGTGRVALSAIRPVRPSSDRSEAVGRRAAPQHERGLSALRERNAGVRALPQILLFPSEIVPTWSPGGVALTGDLFEGTAGRCSSHLVGPS